MEWWIVWNRFGMFLHDTRHMWSINLFSRPPRPASLTLQMSQPHTHTHVHNTLYAVHCSDVMTNPVLLSLRGKWKTTLSLCLHFHHTGQSGLGKSTLMNTLFKSKVSRKSVQPNPEERIPKTIEIKSISHGWPLFISVQFGHFILILFPVYV